MLDRFRIALISRGAASDHDPRNTAILRYALSALQILAKRSVNEPGDRDAPARCLPSHFVAKAGFQSHRLDRLGSLTER